MMNDLALSRNLGKVQELTSFTFQSNGSRAAALVSKIYDNIFIIFCIVCPASYM